MLQRSKGVVKSGTKADKKRQKTVTSMKGGSVEVFAPLSIAPDRAHEERFDSGPRILEKIKLHIKNLLEAKWYGVTYDIVPSDVQASKRGGRSVARRRHDQLEQRAARLHIHLRSRP